MRRCNLAVLAALACSPGGVTPSVETAPRRPRAVQVAAANYNACARFDDGTVSCWGRCSMGCPVRSHDTSSGMQPVAGLADAVDVAVGEDFACAARSDGAVACWGGNFYGALGATGIDWSAAPRTVAGLGGVVEVEATQTMTCARTRDGEVLVWGGVADATPPPPDATRTPTAITAMRGATALFADPWGCCAALEGGRYACTAGDGREATIRPTRTGACGCTLDAEGKLSCQARSLPGPPTADGSFVEPPLLPCAIAALDGVVDFVVADGSGYALRRGGQLWRWGEVDARGGHTEPTMMATPSQVRSIAAGVRGAVFAVDDAGSLWGWGWSHEDGITHADQRVDVPLRMWDPAAPP